MKQDPRFLCKFSSFFFFFLLCFISFGDCYSDDSSEYTANRGANELLLVLGCRSVVGSLPGVDKDLGSIIGTLKKKKANSDKSKLCGDETMILRTPGWPSVVERL